MKKLILRVGIGLLVLLILAVLAVNLFLDGAVKHGIETIGSQLTQVDVKLDAVKLSLLSGSGEIKGLVVGNPNGYSTPNAISVGSAGLAVKPASLFSDKVVIRYIHVDSPDITLEGNLSGNNLSQILSNVESATGGGKTNAPAAAGQAKPGKKLEVDDLVITGARVSLSLKGSGQRTTVTLPDIHLADLGTGPEGITSADLTKQVLQAIERAALNAAAGGINEITKNAETIVKDMGRSANSGVSNITSSVSNVTKGLNDLFKK
jgi:uncharacterized protein involved in outer membrane biogenesis